MVEARADNHVALRVSDIDRSIRFWQEALGARLVAAPTVLEGPYIETVFGPGVRVRKCHLALAANALELWQFLEPVAPIPPGEQTAVGIMHFGVTVPDVPAALARVEAAGGRARFPVKRLGGGGPARFVYCEDPDGHVFELLDLPHEDVVRLIVAGNPDAAVPDGA